MAVPPTPNGIQSFNNDLGPSPIQSFYCDGSNTDTPPTPPVFSASRIRVTLDTEGMAAGYVVRMITNSATGVTNNNTVPNARAIGVTDDPTGPTFNPVIIDGNPLVNFVTDDGAPVAGAPVYIAGSGNDAGFGVGRLTPIAPTASGAIVAEVGICSDASTWLADKTATVIWDPKEPVVNP